MLNSEYAVYDLYQIRNIVKFGIIVKYLCACKRTVKYYRNILLAFSFFRKEGDNEFMNIITNEINTQVRLEPHCLVSGVSS